jgi:hypothetical protein
VNRTGSIPFFTSANSSRSWGSFLRPIETTGRAEVRDCVGVSGVQAGVGCVGLGQRVLPQVLRLQGLGSAWRSGEGARWSFR